MNISDKMIFDGRTIISSIIAIGYTVYAMKTKKFIRDYDSDKFHKFSRRQKKICMSFNFIITCIIGISGIYILIKTLL